MMKKLMTLLCVLSLFSMAINAKDKNEDLFQYNYELGFVRSSVAATSGHKVIKVYSYCKKKELLTEEVCMRNAIHGILFKGVVATDEGTEGSLPALCPEGYAAHKEYFENFFRSGEYKQFIQLTSRGSQQAGDVVKMANKEWKVGFLVQVNLNALRTRLERDGIIESVRSLFSR